jgi:hypothetical protein
MTMHSYMIPAYKLHRRKVGTFYSALPSITHVLHSEMGLGAALEEISKNKKGTVLHVVHVIPTVFEWPCEVRAARASYSSAS